MNRTFDEDDKNHGQSGCRMKVIKRRSAGKMTFSERTQYHVLNNGTILLLYSIYRLRESCDYRFRHTRWEEKKKK